MADIKDSYNTLATLSMGEFKDKGSKFIAYAYPVQTDKDIQNCIEEVKKEHFKARHHCYAYRLGRDGKTYRANDDGEPSGTAGRPILGQIDSFGLAHVFIVVVRYFGGVKLGTSGLKNAYKGAARDALEQAEIIEHIIENEFQLIFDYPQMNDVMKFIKSENIQILESNYEAKAILKVSVRQGLIPTFEETMNDIENLELDLLKEGI